LTHHDLTGVMQMLGHAHQTAALHINASDTDGVLFYDAGTIAHAECGNLFGDEAVITFEELWKHQRRRLQIYLRNQVGTAHRAALGTDLMMDAMRRI